jgi:hypothetical protein
MPDDLTLADKLPSAHVNRHAWALEKHGHLLSEALRKDTSAAAREVEKLPEGYIPGRVVSLILERADPTQNKGMTSWLVRQYAEGNLRLEDLGTANETLTMFRRYAQRLEPSQRDLGQYPSLAAVWEAVIAFANAEEQHISGKAKKALDRDKAYAESRILRQDPDGFTIAVPLTEFAAKWWGRGTRWCTAAEKDNQFWYYHKDAPLIVIVIPELGQHGKFQLWASKSKVQFMSATDKPVSDEMLKANWDRFKALAHWALNQNGMALSCFPKSKRTKKLYQIAVAQNGWALECIPEALRSEELCRIAVAQNGDALHRVPERLRTEEMCRLAVSQNGEALGSVPCALRTEEICEISVTQCGNSLIRVPNRLRTEALCKIAVAQNGIALHVVPKRLRTEELFSIAVGRHGEALRNVPEALRTAELCRIAVAQDGVALPWVPEYLRTKALCRTAVEQNGRALTYVPEKLRTDEMCRIAVTQNGRALEAVPWHLRTAELCRIAVAQCGSVLESVPGALHTEMALLAKQNERNPQVPSWGHSLIDHLEEALRPSPECRGPARMRSYA